MAIFMLDEFGTIRISEKRPAVKKITVEAVCDEDISYPQLKQTVRKIKKQFGGGADCKISRLDGSVCVVVSSSQQAGKTVSEKFFSE